MAVTKRAGSELNFFTGDLYQQATGSKFETGTTYYEKTAENNYVVTLDSSWNTSKTYYIKKTFLSDTSTLVAGNVYFAVDPIKKTGEIYYDVDSTHRVLMSTSQTPTVFDNPVTFKTTSQIRMNSIEDAEFSQDTTASIFTRGGIAVRSTLAAKKVRIDDNATSKGSGCEMVYNATEKCLEFQFA